MSEFAVVVEEIVIEEHPNADAIEIARIRGYQAIVKKGDFQTGDLVAYIPEASLVPELILEEMNLVGRLAGSQKNRVKAIRLRGVLSQGLCYPIHKNGWKKGQDVTEELGIKKYEPPIPTCLAGQVWYAGGRRTLKYDIQNWKNNPEVIRDGEEVVFTEKLHGTFMGVCLLPEILAAPNEGDVTVFSKGLGASGKCMKLSTPANEKNLYVRTFKLFEENFLRGRGILETKDSDGLLFPPESPVFILGEVFGKGVQDLSYGYDTGTDRIGYRVFDVYVGHRDLGRYLNDNELDFFCSATGIDRVPVLYRGPFSVDVMNEHTDGKETLTGKNWNIREGIVMRPVVERKDLELGRVILKSVSGKYLTRKHGTEHN